MLSPLTRKRLDSFFRNARARWALNALCLLFGISLIAELLCNSRPLYLRTNSRHFFPFIQSLTLRDLTTPSAEPVHVNYQTFTATRAFKDDPANRVLWAPVRYSPGDVVDATSLDAYRTVKVSIIPVTDAGRLNMLPDHTLILPLSCEPFFPDVKRIEGLQLDAHWKLTEELKTAVARRFAGHGGPRVQVLLQHAKIPGLRARVTLLESAATQKPPTSLRLSFRQVETPDLPVQLRFRRTPDNRVVPLERRLWQNIPSAAQTAIRKLATEAFKGHVPSTTIAWRNRQATLACALNEIAWPFPPVPGHWMGIDAAGRDVLSRVLYGMRISLLFGLILAVWALFSGVFIGAIQGYFGGRIDMLGQRLTEIWSALPFLYVMIFVGSALGRSFLVLLICYSLFNWIGISYYMRAEFLRLRSQAFVDAARCQGLSGARIIFNHILPNALTPLITLFPFVLLGAISSLAALDFLGFGLPPLTPSWGELLQQAQMFRWAWWLILFPSLALFIVMFLTVLVGEGLRDAFDPRQQSKME